MGDKGAKQKTRLRTSRPCHNDKSTCVICRISGLKEMVKKVGIAKTGGEVIRKEGD